MALTKIVANITRHETVTYLIDGPVDASRAHDIIASGEYDPTRSVVHHDDIDIVEVVVHR